VRFLVDECTGPAIARWLREQNQEVFSVYEEARGVDDSAILQKASEENWILITNDKGFGGKVFRDQQAHRGMIVLRLDDKRGSNNIRSSFDYLEIMRTSWLIIL